MKCFQIEKNEVLIVDGEKNYVDTVENFKADSGIESLPVRVWYNDEQPYVVIKQDSDSEELWESYPIAEYDDYIAAIDDYIAAKKQREYIPLPEPTEAEQTASKAAAIASDYEDQLADLKDSMVTAMLMGDTELQDELKEEYTELITEYYEALEALNND